MEIGSTMTSGEGDVGAMMESQVEDSFKPENQVSDINRSKYGSNRNLVKENGLSDDSQCPADTHDQLILMVTELKFQNEFLKSQFEVLSSLNSVHSDSSTPKKIGGVEDGESDILKELQGRVESLNKELVIEKQTRGAAEEALKHLQTAYSEADTKVQELSEKLAEGMTLFICLCVCKTHAATIQEQT